MKKLIAVLIVAALLMGALTGCVTQTQKSDAEMFLALWEEFLEQTEYTFASEMTMQSEDPEMIAAGMGQMSVKMSGTVSLERHEMQMTMTQSLIEEGPDMEMEMFATADEILLDMGGMVQFMFDLIFAEFGMGALSIDIAQVLGDTMFVRLPLDTEEDAADALFFPVFVGRSLTYEELTAHLTRDEDDVFTLILEGEMLERAMDDVIAMMSQFSIDFGELGEEMGMDGAELDWEELFEDMDFSDARLDTSISRDGDSFSLVVDWDIPGVSTSRMESIYTAVEVAPLDVPEGMTMQEFTEFMDDLDFDALFPDMFSDFGGDFDFGSGLGTDREFIYNIVYDLAGLNLIDHTLPADSLLQTVALPDGFEGENIVTIIAEVDFFVGEWEINGGNDRLWLYYVSWYDMDAVEAVKWMAENDRAAFFYDDSQLMFSDLRTNRDYTMAVMAIGEISADGLERYLCIYIAQVIPETEDVILLDLTLFMDIMWEEDYEIVAELGEHIGVDLLAFVSELLGQTL